MGELVLVRHAQASFFGASYDELSPLGRAQARALGDYWAAHGVRFDRVFVGPRRRHRQTLELVGAAYRERGLSWPDAHEVAELDEHQGLTVIRHRLGAGEARSEAMHAGDPGEAGREQAVRTFFRHYLEIMRDWSRGTLVVPDVEPWAEFRARTLRALDVLCEGGGGDRRVAFTSGGTVSSAAGWLLGLDDERVIDLSAVLRNTALSEVRWSARRRSLVSFNALPHIHDPGAATAV